MLKITRRRLTVSFGVTAGMQDKSRLLPLPRIRKEAKDLSSNEIPIAQLIRSRRRSLALEIRPDGTLIVRAPHFVKDSVIQKFVSQKSEWIEKVYHRTREQLEIVSPKKFIEGEKFLYLGKEYTLHIAADISGKLLFEDQFILSARYLPKARKLFERWYREEAFLIFTQRCRFYAPKMGGPYQRIKLSSAKHRWGSCNPKGSLCFNWRLVMAPQETIDYVVIHELAHLKEPNHSVRFWEAVEKVFPDYRAAKKWLKENQLRLYL